MRSLSPARLLSPDLVEMVLGHVGSPTQLAVSTPGCESAQSQLSRPMAPVTRPFLVYVPLLRRLLSLDPLT